MKLQAIQALSVGVGQKQQQTPIRVAHAQQASPLMGEDQLLFSGQGSRYAAGLTLFTVMAALTALTPWGTSNPKADTLGRMDAPASSINLSAVLPHNPVITARAGLDRTVPFPLQSVEGTMVHYKLDGPKNDPDGFNTLGFKDKQGKAHWLVPDGFNGDMYGSIDDAVFKIPGLQNGQRAVFVGISSPTNTVNVNDVFVGSPFFVERIQSPEGKVLWSNPDFQSWADRIMSSPKLHAGILEGEKGIQIPALLPNTPEPKNP